MFPMFLPFFFFFCLFCICAEMGDLSVKPRDCPLAVTEYNSLENELKPLDKTEIKAQLKKKKRKLSQPQPSHSF